MNGFSQFLTIVFISDANNSDIKFIFVEEVMLVDFIFLIRCSVTSKPMSAEIKTDSISSKISSLILLDFIELVIFEDRKDDDFYDLYSRRKMYLSK